MTAPERSNPRTFSHHGATVRSMSLRPRTRREHGYTMVMTALLLVPLMGFTGFAIDIGGWYATGARLQRSADAAALAGAALMPDFSTAQAVATATAKKNGYATGGEITVTVTRLGERKIKVTIADSKVDQYFSQLFIKSFSISRSAVAEFVLPVPLGSPENYFGNLALNPILTDPSQPGLWGNIHGPKTPNGNGDRYGAGCRPSEGCSSPTNVEYRGFYIYQLDIPTGSSAVSVDLYDAGLYPKTNQQTDTGDVDYTPGSGTVTTTWGMYGPDTSLLDYNDATPLAGQCNAGPGALTLPQDTTASPYSSQWATLCQLTTPVPGRYLIKVATSGTGSGANRYSIRAIASSGTQPRLSAFGDMSMFNNQLTVNPNFYLAQVDQIHAGKTFLVSLYDPGEIAVPNAKMQILDPSGSVASTCTVTVFNNPTDSTPASTSTNSPCSILTTNSTGGALFNGKLLSIAIKIPTTYSCTVCWWKVRYDLGGATSGTPNDTTTWSATIKGDPVHLVNE